MKHLGQFDGLRALGALLIVMHHSVSSAVIKATQHTPTLSYFGELVYYTTNSGLILFFILSGVFLLRPYLRGVRQLDLDRYVTNRIYRLWPPFFLAWLFAGFVILVATYYPTWYSQAVLPTFRLMDWLAQLAMINIGRIPYNGAWWYLTLQIFFYALVPFLVVILSSRVINKPVIMLSSFLSLLLAIIALQIYNNQYHEIYSRDVATSIISLLMTFGLYLPAFVFGVLMAKVDFPVSFGKLLALLGILYVVVAVKYSLLNVHNGYAIMYSGVIIICFDGDSKLSSLLSVSPLIWLGERSYSLYLTHFTVFYLVNYLLSQSFTSATLIYGGLSRLIGIPMSLIVATVLFNTIERNRLVKRKSI